MLDEESRSGAAQQLGRRLREARTAKGWTLRTAAGETGISNGYLSLIEHGEVKAPSPRYLLAMAEKYGLSYDELMGLAGHPSGPLPTSAGTPPTPVAERAAPASTVSGRANDGAQRGWSRSNLTAVFGTAGRAVDSMAHSEQREDHDASEAGDQGRHAAAAEPPSALRSGPRTEDELADDEWEQLMALVRNDMRGLTSSDIANVRAFIAGLRATRRR